MKLIFKNFKSYDLELPTLVCVNTNVKTECDRLLLSFIPVVAVALFLLPRVIHPSTSSNELTTYIDNPSTYGPVLGCSRTLSLNKNKTTQVSNMANCMIIPFS